MNLNTHNFLVVLMIFLTFSLDARYNAGVFPFAKHNGKIWFLVGEEPRWKAYSDFGGKEDARDTGNTRMTAAREFVEETNFIYGQKERIYPKLKEEFGFGDRNKYRTYLLEVPYKTIKEIKNKPKHKDSDKSDYTWIPAEDLLNAVAASANDRSVKVVDWEGKEITIFHRFVWILRTYDNQIRDIIKLPSLAESEKSVEMQQAFIELQGNKYPVTSVSVLPFAFDNNRALFLLGADVINSYFMYFDFGSLVDDNSFVKGIFNPILSAAYGFQKVRDLFGYDSLSFIKNAIIKSNQMSVYNTSEKHLMFLAEIDYKNFDFSKYPCQWIDVDLFLRWLKQATVDGNQLNIPVFYNKLAIYQPFAARLKAAMFEVEKAIIEVKNKRLTHQRVDKHYVTLKKSLLELYEKLNQLQRAF